MPVSGRWTGTLPTADQLRWTCRRGMLELDLLLTGFLDHGYQGLSESEKHQFLHLLDGDDQELLELLTGKATPPTADMAALIGKVRGEG